MQLSPQEQPHDCSKWARSVPKTASFGCSRSATMYWNLIPSRKWQQNLQPGSQTLYSIHLAADGHGGGILLDRSFFLGHTGKHGLNQQVQTCRFTNFAATAMACL